MAIYYEISHWVFQHLFGVGKPVIFVEDSCLISEVKFLHIPLEINLALWFVAICTLIVVSSTYLLKIIYHFEAVRREFFHPVRVDFFAPWVACMY
eukprot:Gb_19767 [translate_table: standard]